MSFGCNLNAFTVIS